MKHVTSPCRVMSIRPPMAVRLTWWERLTRTHRDVTWGGTLNDYRSRAKLPIASATGLR